MSGKLKAVSRLNPCPVCGGTSSCSIIEQDAAWVCWRTRDQYSCPPGYRFVRLAKSDMGGIIMVDNGQRQWSEEEKKEWGRQQAAQRRARQELERQKLKELLPNNIRDREYRKIGKSLSLSSTHKTNLYKRGVLPTEVQQLESWGWIKTWEPQKIIPGINRQLPGVGKSYQLVGVKGMVIFKHSPDNEIVGGEIAADVRSDGKYKPLTSSFCGGATPHLQNGDMPVTVWRHPEANGINGIDQVIITEGSLKSLVTAVKYWRINKNIVVVGKQIIGSSHATVNEYLSQLGCSNIAIAPDAGAVDHKDGKPNQHIMNAYRQIVETGKQANPSFNFTFLWWGQKTKLPEKQFPGVDIDDLNLDKIKSEVKNIKAETFFKMVEKQTSAPIKYNVLENPNWDKEPDSQEYSNYLEFEKQQELILAEEKKENFVVRMFNWLPQIFSKKSSRHNYNTIVSECLLPDKDFDGEISKSNVTWKYQSGQDITVYQAAIKAGYKYILNSSGTGAGKTTAISLINDVQELGGKYLFYIHPSHRNPMVPGIEDRFIDLPTRHDGLVLDYSKRTGNGNPHVIRPRNAEEKLNAEIESNCQYADVFVKAQQNNLDKMLGDELCKACPSYKDCQHDVGNGYGFKHQRRHVLQSASSHNGLIRAHISSLPDIKDWNYTQSVAVLDEPKAWLEPHTSFVVTKKDVAEAWVKLEKNAPEAFIKVRGLLAEIYDLWDVNDKVLGRFGWDDNRVRAKLIECLDGLSSEEIKIIADNIEHFFYPDLSWMKDQQDEIDTTMMSAKEKKLMLAASRALKQETAMSSDEAIKALDNQLNKNWLSDLLRVLAGSRGSMSFNKTGLSLAITNDRNQQILSAFGAVILLDATMHPDDLAATLGCSTDDICVICQEGFEKAIPSNLNIIQVKGFGHLGKKRSTTQTERLNVLSNELDHLYRGRIGIVDWKDSIPDSPKKDFKHLTWFAGSRGSNLFEGREALQINGLPYPNMGAIATRYQMITGESVDLNNIDPGFASYYQRCIQEEIWQAIGRLRAGRRTQALDCYLVFDDPDFDLGFLGCEVQETDAATIHPMAGSAIDRNRHLVVEAIKTLASTVKNRRGLSQQKIAEESHVAQSTISSLAGGRWNEIIEIVINKSISDFDKIYSLLGGKEKQLVDQLRGQELAQLGTNAETLAKLIKEYGWKIVAIALQGVSDKIKSQVIDIVLGLLPWDKKKDLLKMVF